MLEDKEGIENGCDYSAGGSMDIQATSKSGVRIFKWPKHISELAKSIHQLKGLQQFIHVVGYMSPFDDKNRKIAIDVFQEETII